MGSAPPQDLHLWLQREADHRRQEFAEVVASLDVRLKEVGLYRSGVRTSHTIDAIANLVGKFAHDAFERAALNSNSLDCHLLVHEQVDGLFQEFASYLSSVVASTGNAMIGAGGDPGLVAKKMLSNIHAELSLFSQRAKYRFELPTATQRERKRGRPKGRGTYEKAGQSGRGSVRKNWRLSIFSPSRNRSLPTTNWPSSSKSPGLCWRR